MGYQFKKFFPAKIFRWHTTPLYELKDMLLKRRENELDNMILVTGSRGSGKTTFTGKVLFNFQEFDPYVSMVYSKEAMFKLIKKKRGFIWADEGVINAAKGNVMSRANKLLFEASTINRDNYNIVFFLMPFIEDFDSKILQYCSAWIHIDSRGLAVLLLPANKGLFGRSNWDISQMKKIYDEFQKNVAGLKHTPYWIFDNFRGYIKFGKLTKEQDSIIKEIKQLRKNENLDREMQEVEVEVKNMDNYVKYSSKKIAEALMKGEIRDQEQFERTCTEMKLNPVEIAKRCDRILKANNLDKNVKGLLKEYQKTDSLIRF